MHTLMLAGLLGALALGFAGTAAFFARAWRRRPQDGEYGIFALLAGALTLFALFAAGAYYRAEIPGEHPTFATMLTALSAMGIVTVALMLVFALRYAGVRYERHIDIALGLVGGAFLVALLTGAWWEPLPAAFPLVRWLGLTLRSVDFTPRPGALLFYLLVPVVALAVIALVARTYRRSRAPGGLREGVTALVGAVVFGATVVNDALFALGVLRGVSLLPLGFVAFVYGVGLTLVARYERTTVVLAQRSEELRRRTEELESSYRALDRAEDDLLRAQQLAVVGELASVIAEQVGAPLVEVERAVAALHRADATPAEALVVLDAIERQSAALDRLVRELLAYARPVTPQAARLGVRELFERSLGPLRALEANRALYVDLAVEIDDDATEVLADPDLMRQALENLVANAVDAMRERALEPGAAHRLTLASARAKDRAAPVVLVSVGDTGTGMSASERLQARRPFFTTRVGHTGLGLSVVERFVGAHGGALHLESELGQGTRVTLAMPMASAPRRRVRTPST